MHHQTRHMRTPAIDGQRSAQGRHGAERPRRTLSPAGNPPLSAPIGAELTTGYLPDLRMLAALVMLVAGAVLPQSPARADTSVIVGPAHVIDADTIDIDGNRIRLWGIDAPERDQTCTLGKLIYNCGQLAADELATFLKERTVRCRRKATDRYAGSDPSAGTDPMTAGKPAGDAGTDPSAGSDPMTAGKPAGDAGTDPSAGSDPMTAGKPAGDAGTAVPAGTDRNGRIVAICHASTGQPAGDGQDIAAWLVENGYAFDWPRYSGGNYRLWQGAARTRRAGLWQGTFEFPWKWRKP